jgi:hypothetical protein
VLLDAAGEDSEYRQWSVKTKKRPTRQITVALAAVLACFAIVVITVPQAIFADRSSSDAPSSGQASIDTTEEEPPYNIPDDLPIRYCIADYVFNPYVYEELVGFADYVFVGEVKSLKDNTLEFLPTDEHNTGDVRFSEVYSYYTVEVIENIKGSLVSEVEIKKIGGVAPSGEYISMMSGDILPRVGEKYIFSASTQQDGTLLLTCENSNIPYSDRKYGEIMEAYENQVEYGRTNYVCKYDTAYAQVDG